MTMSLDLIQEYWQWVIGVLSLPLIIKVLQESFIKRFIRTYGRALTENFSNVYIWRANLDPELEEGVTQFKDRWYISRHYVNQVPEETKELILIDSAREEQKKVEDLYTNYPISDKKVESFFIGRLGKWKSPEKTIYIIAANSGMGKTQLLIKLFLSITQSWKNIFGFKSNPNCYLFSLKNNPLKAPNSQLREQIKQNKIRKSIVLLDGLDEIDDGASIDEHLTFIVDQLKDAHSIVISCRASHLLGKIDQLGRLQNYKGFVWSHFFLIPFRPYKEVRSYINKRYRRGLWILPSSSYRKAQNIASEGIFQRPLLLSYSNLFFEPLVKFSEQFIERLSFPEDIADDMQGILKKKAMSGYCTRQDLEERLTTIQKETSNPRLRHQLINYLPVILKNCEVEMDLTSLSEVYERIVSVWIQREADRSKISSSLLLELCRKKALELYEKGGRYTTDFSIWHKGLKVTLKGQKQFEGSLLVKANDFESDNPAYRFSHKSIYEFLLGQHLFENKLDVWEFDFARFPFSGIIYSSFLQDQCKTCDVDWMTRQKEGTHIKLADSPIGIPEVLFCFPESNQLSIEQEDQEPILLKSEDTSLSGASFLAKWKELESLSLTNQRLMDEQITWLAHMNSLKNLDLSHNNLVDPSILNYLAKLESLTINDNPIISLKAVLYKGKGLSKLTVNHNNLDAEQLLLIDSQYPQEEVLRRYCSMDGIPVNYMLYQYSFTDFKGLVRQGKLDLTLTNEEGKHLLIFAAQSGDWGLVSFLLQQPEININQGSTTGRTALMSAALKDSQLVVELLLAHPHVSINQKSYRSKASALVYCAFEDSDNAAKALLAHPKIDVNLTDALGNTALMYCGHHNSPKVAKLLLARPEVDVMKENNIGRSALLVAAFHDSYAVVEQLLAHPQISVNHTDQESNTALIVAAMNDNEASIFQLLGHKNIDINIGNKVGETALEYCARYNSLKAATLLLANPRIDKNPIDHSGKNILIAAAIGDSLSVAELILDQTSIDVNARDPNGWTALMFAVNQNSFRIVELLLGQSEIKIDQKSFDGESALSLAYKKGNWEMVSFLKGVPSNIADENN